MTVSACMQFPDRKALSYRSVLPSFPSPSNQISNGPRQVIPPNFCQIKIGVRGLAETNSCDMKAQSPASPGGEKVGENLECLSPRARLCSRSDPSS